MGMRWDRCWFENCREAGSTLDLDGKHPRNLCTKHAESLGKALELPGTVRVSWGRSKAEQLAELESQRSSLAAEHNAAQATLDGFLARPFELDEFGMEPEAHETERERLERIEWHAHMEMGGIEGQIGDVNRRTWDHPIVRVHMKSD